jgi:hypothetical protein
MGCLVWQAVSGLHYDDTNGYAWRQVDASGLGSTEGPLSSVSALLGPELLGQIPAPPSRVSAATMYRLRVTLLDWKVGNIVFVSGYPDQKGWDARIITAVLGWEPAHVGGSLVWTGVFQRLVVQRGVGIRTADDRTHYFWTFHPRTVLQTLAEHGYVIGEDRRADL